MVTGSVTINASPASAELGDTITFTGRALIDGEPIPGLLISIYLDAAPAPPVFLSGGENDSNGYYNIQWTSNYLGNLPIYALAAALQGFTSPTIAVLINEPTTPTGFTFTVTDATTAQPIQGALCSIHRGRDAAGESLSGLTNASGIAVLVDVWFSPQSWMVSKEGYTTLVSNEIAFQINVALTPTAGLPNPQITSVDYPPTATPGQEVTITWTVQNQGENTNLQQWTRLMDDDTDELFHNTILPLPAGAEAEVVAVLLMPDRTWNLRIDAGYNEVVTASRRVRVGDGASSLLSLAAIGLLAYIVLKK